jgi:uncharacterized protein YuzE
MKVVYDTEVDVLRIIYTETLIEESDPDASGVILDYDEAGTVVSLEILNASRRVRDPKSLDHIVLD